MLFGVCGMGQKKERASAAWSLEDALFYVVRVSISPECVFFWSSTALGLPYTLAYDDGYL